MDTLAIPSDSSNPPLDHLHSLRSVRSAGSMRTPYKSANNTNGNVMYGYGYGPRSSSNSLSPPNLSFSNTTLISDPEPDFFIGGIASLPSTAAGDSWNSRMSKGKSSQSRVRLNNVFGNTLPGFPYINSAAAATTGATSSDLRNKASWSDTIGTASGSVQSHSVRRSSATTKTSMDADSSCSASSNSSDDVDLDLSWDLDIVRARQQAQQTRHAQSRLQKGKAAHIGIEISPSLHPPEQAEIGTSRYRLTGRQRMSRSAIELRPDRQVVHSNTQEAAYPRNTDASARSDPGRLATPSSASFDTRSAGSLTVQMSGPEYEDNGWSFATTPPLSPSELVTFAEQQNSSLSHGTKYDRSSGLFRKRRPTAPLMQLLDKATRSSPASIPSEASSPSWHSPTPTQLNTADAYAADSSPAMTAMTISPETSNWTSPKSPDEIHTPNTGELAQFRQMYLVADSQDVIRQQQAVKSRQGQMKANEQEATHTRRSSSLLRFPFTSFLGSFRPTTPASTPVTILEGPTQFQADSPTQVTSEEGHSQESHSHESQESQQQSPPRLGATSRAHISESMMRPGPNTGQGRLTGLGLQFPSARPRQSSLPVLSFSSPSEEFHGHPRSANENAMEVLHTHRPASAPSNRVQFAAPPQEISRSRSQSIIPIHEQKPNVDLKGTHRRNGIRAMRASSGLDIRGRIDRMKPSQLLFFAAFLLGPWCFVLGGWALRAIDGECMSIKGIRCRCTSSLRSCDCQAELYRQLRLTGTAQQLDGRGLTKKQKMDRFVLANRVAALLCGSISLILAVVALIAVSRTW